MLFDGQLMKTGKRAPRLDPRTLRLAKYLAPTLPVPPAEVSWVTKVPSWSMMLNDRLGDCVLAAAGHMIEQWSFYAGDEVIPTDQQILEAYCVVGGYEPGNPSTDDGADMLSALQYWKGTGIAGHKIAAYMAVNFLNQEEIRTAIELFGNVYLGVQLPISAQGESAWTVADGGIYTQDGEPGSWGGHCIPLMAASPETATCITWGQRLKMSWNFLRDYADEAYVVLSSDWIAKNGLSPSLFNLNQLMTDIAAL